MKRIEISQFKFIFRGSGCYKVIYETPSRGDYWVHITNNMPLIDATKNAENPTQVALKQLRTECKQCGTHYNCWGKEFD